MASSAVQEREVVTTHPVFLVDDPTSGSWLRFQDAVARSYEGAGSPPSTDQVAGIASRWVLRTVDGDPATTASQQYSWRILINNVDRNVGSEYPSTTTAYGQDTTFVQEVVLHELMHVMGADHVTPHSVGNQNSNGNRLASIMPEKHCADSLGHLGATAWGDTVNHPSSTPGHLILPSADQAFLQEHYDTAGTGWWQEPPPERRIMPWYARYRPTENCVEYLPLADVDASVTNIPEVQPLYGCPGGLAVDKTGGRTHGFSGWYSALQDFSFTPPFSPHVDYVVEPLVEGDKESAVTAYTAFQSGQIATPSTSPANLRRTMYVPPMAPGMWVHADTPLLPSCGVGCDRTAEYKNVQMLGLRHSAGATVGPASEWLTVPLNIEFDPPRECPVGTSAPDGWPATEPLYSGTGSEWPCCIAEEH